MALLDHIDERFERWGERFNPVVVKETRQAIRSKGFPFAFMAMLATCVTITAALVVHYGEQLYQAEAGPHFFAWYFGCLLWTVCFVAPLGLFQSVVSEFDGRTFEALAVTTLTPGQIVFGKLKGALVHMGAYYSAAAPFLCFTYMLEGVSIPGVALSLVIALLAGVSACMGSMMLASLARQPAGRMFALLLSLVLGLVVFGIALGAGTTTVSKPLAWGSLGLVCTGFGLFGYVFLFFSLLTMGVSIAQFTPTLPRGAAIEFNRPGGVRSRKAPAASKAGASAVANSGGASLPSIAEPHGAASASGPASTSATS